MLTTQNIAHDVTHLASYKSLVDEECDDCNLFKGALVVLTPDFAFLALTSPVGISTPVLNIIWSTVSYYLSRAPPPKV